MILKRNFASKYGTASAFHSKHPKAHQTFSSQTLRASYKSCNCPHVRDGTSQNRPRPIS